VRHARVSFGVAARFAGASFGPARLDTSGTTPLRATLYDLIATTIRDGCVNETVSALRVCAAANAASDPAVRAALERIAADEAAHAELAWHTVAWALRAGGAEAVQLAEQAFAEALAVGSSAAAAELHTGTDALRAYGQLGEHEAAQVTLATLADVVAPCAHALLASTRGTQAHESAARRAS
jgi:hypothetical protein